MFKFTKARDKMSFESIRPKIQKDLSSWEIESVRKFVSELKNPCVNEWTVSALPRELGWLLSPAIRRLEVYKDDYRIFWEDSFSRKLDEDETKSLKEYLKQKTTFRQEMIEYSDLPKVFQQFWKKR